jgi:hypothetical protein
LASSALAKASKKRLQKFGRAALQEQAALFVFVENCCIFERMLAVTLRFLWEIWSTFIIVLGLTAINL